MRDVEEEDLDPDSILEDDFDAVVDVDENLDSGGPIKDDDNLESNGPLVDDGVDLEPSELLDSGGFTAVDW